MAVEASSVPLDYRVVTVDPHGLVIVRDGKGEDLPVQLLLALHVSKKCDKSP